MAGDWIKITHELPDKPEVLSIADQLSVSRFEVVGRLHVVWRWFDQHTKNGHAEGVTSVTLAVCLFGDAVGTRFIQAMIKFGWLTETDAGVFIPNFDYHISETAKTRAMSSNRKKKQRSSEGNVTQKTDERDKSVTREEKNREEKILKPSFVEREGVTDISSSVVSVTQSRTPIDAFPMNLEWCPSTDFIRNLPCSIGTDRTLWVDELLEFCTYWQSTGEKCNHAKWENKFLKNLESNQKFREENLIS